MRLKIVIVSLLLLSLLTSCRETIPDETGQPKTTPKLVKTEFVAFAKDPVSSSYTGTVIPQNRAVIQSKLQAWVKSIPASLGTRVSKGDLLIELDSRDLAAQVSQAQSVELKAAADLKRFAELLSRKLVSQQEYDASHVQAEIARAALLEAQVMLSYARIQAPFNGTVTQRFVNVGDLTQFGVPLITIEESGPLQFSAMLPESRLGHFRKNDTVEVHVPSIDTTITGTVLMIAESADPETHSFEVRVGFPVVQKLKAGMFGRLQEKGSPDDHSLWIPTTALIKRGQLDLVFVIDADQKAVLRLVRVGQQSTDSIQILAGLNEGEQVIVNGQTMLSDGDAVEVIK
jgi:RND family efflux transporter MFP subunit